MLPANCTKEIKPLVTHVIDLIFGQSEEGKKGQLLAEFTELAPAMRDVIKKAASTAALAMKPIIPSFTMPDLSGVTGAMSTAFDAVKEKTHSAFDAVKGKVGNLMPKQPHWRDQLEQLKAQVANMGAHVEAIPTIKGLEGEVKKLKAELNAAQATQTVPATQTAQATRIFTNNNNNDFSNNSTDFTQDPAPTFQLPPSLPTSSLPTTQRPAKELFSPARRSPFGATRGFRSANNSNQGGGRSTLRNRRIRASTRSLRQRARE